MLAIATPGAAQVSPETLKSLSIPNKVETRLGTLEFEDGAPSAATAQKVYDNLDFLHAQNVFLNTFQGASTYAMGEGLHSIGVEDNSFVIFPNLMDSKSLFLTANADTIVADADGTTTVYFGPTLPAGVKDGNWIQTVPGKGYFVCLRLYSPLEPFFTKEWRPSEIELVR